MNESLLPDSIILDGRTFTTADIRMELSNNDLPKWKVPVYQFILEWFDENEYISQKTSGSTGVPKSMLLKKSSMIASAKATLRYFQLLPGNTALLCLPIDYIAGKMMVVRAIIGQLNLLLSEPSGLPQLPVQEVDFSAMVPLQIKRLIDKNTDFSTLKKIIIGGASVDYLLQNDIKTIPSAVFSTYGMTETCSHIALQRLNSEFPDNHFSTLDGVTVHLNDSGCLVIDAPHLSEQPFVTTDRAEVISPSEFRWLGRIDHIINSGGIKISPEEIESIIAPLIGAECIVSSIKDDMLGMKAVLVINKLPEGKTNESLLAEISLLTGKYKAPKEIIEMATFPRNSNMKIDRIEVERLINKTK